LYYYYWTNNGADSNGAGNTAALAAAAQNGYANDGSSSTQKEGTTTVVVNIPPTSGLYTGKSGYAEVIVTNYEPRGFSRLFGNGSIPIVARAVAVGMPVAAQVGILVLDTNNDKGTLYADGGGTLTVVDTPIVNNSTNSQASISNGGTVVTAPSFDYNQTGWYNIVGNGSFNGDPITMSAPMPDPLQYLPVPNPSNMTQQSNKKTQYTSGDNTLSPGVYKGGITASGSANITLQPGNYYMDGGGFSFSGQGNLTGNGVMIYNTTDKNGNSANLSVSGSGAINLSGPTSGAYQGLTFWQDRNVSIPAAVSGGAGSSMSGTFYFPSAPLTVTGGSGFTNVGSQYISYQLTVKGGGAMNLQWNPITVARRRMVALVE
jgi:hypothetical protein